MADLSVIESSPGGVASSFQAADAAGDKFENDGKTVIWVKNDDGSSHTVTPQEASGGECNHGFSHEAGLVIPAGDSRVIGPFPSGRYNDANGDVSLTYDAVTSVSVQAVTLGDVKGG